MSRRRAQPGPRPEITQAECVEYLRLHARLKRLEEDVAVRKQSLIDRVRRRAAVEPGKWLPQVDPRETRNFSAEIVEGAFGRAAMLEAWAKIRPSRSYTLKFVEEIT